MQCTRERALELLDRWRAQGSWLFAVARFSEGDEHRFWARVQTSGRSELWLAGESAMVSLRLEHNACQYSEVLALPPDFSEHLSDFCQGLVIRCNEFSAVLGALSSDADKS
ncbi:MAG TPA: hypothetical protein VGZ29_04140 [Terriglobia bacterium]|nr:hypothetical protein [Terriglobia bacterium]